MATRSPSCIIIGSGLAGLTAALRLVERGWNVEIFEAFDFFGGRVYTHHFDKAPSLNCELGGEWIGEQHQRIQGLCRQFKLHTQSHRYSSAFPAVARPGATRFVRAGGWPFRLKNKTKLDKFLKKFNGYDECKLKELDRYDWWTWLQTKMNFDDADLLRRDLMDSTDFGETIRLTSAFVAAAEYANSNRYDEMDKKVIGGNHRLPEAMINYLLATGRAKLHLGKKVSRVVQKKNLRVLVTADSLVRQPNGSYEWVKPGLTSEADFCICTIPARALNSITWQPPLPDEHVDAANQLQYCRIVKTTVLYKTRFWERGNFKPSGGGYSWFTDGVSDFCFDATQGQNEDEHGIICSYAVGDKADDLAHAPYSDLKKWITQDIARACGLKPQYQLAIDIKRRAWQENPFAQGAYAYYRSGQWFTVRPILRRSHLRVHFAGEHLDDDWQGFMEGAVSTGEDAASKI
jgi:monoamine oxidase